MNRDNGCSMVVLAIIGVGVLLVVSSIASGFALSVLWGWFIVPVFNTPALTVVQAIGIAMVVSYLTYQYQSNNGKSSSSDSVTDALVKAIMMAVARPVLALVFGWAVQLFL